MSTMFGYELTLALDAYLRSIFPQFLHFLLFLYIAIVIPRCLSYVHKPCINKEPQVSSITIQSYIYRSVDGLLASQGTQQPL